jgi:hypothetical protein
LCLVQENLVCIGQASAGWQVECLSPLVVGEGFQVGNGPGKAVVEDWILHWNVYWNECVYIDGIFFCSCLLLQDYFLQKEGFCSRMIFVLRFFVLRQVFVLHSFLF